MICLTGDLHHASLCTGNQQHSDRGEIEVAQDYLRMLEARDIRSTFFVSGRAFVEEEAALRPILSSPLTEIGGHNWNCFQPEMVHRIWNRLTGSYNGPEWYQRRDAIRTIETIRDLTGIQIRAWRNHMYMHGPHTERALAAAGIELCSDGVSRRATGPRWHRDGIWNLPLNVIPDHEHIYHAERTPEWVRDWVARYGWSDDFGSDSYRVDRWADLVVEQLERREARGVLSTLIIHPITMYLADDFVAVQRILDYVATRRTVLVSDVIDHARRGDFHKAA